MKNSSASNIICRYKNEDRIEKFTRTGRPRIKRREERAVVQNIKKDRLITEKIIAKEVQEEFFKRASRSTV